VPAKRAVGRVLPRAVAVIHRRHSNPSDCAAVHIGYLPAISAETATKVRVSSFIDPGCWPGYTGASFTALTTSDAVSVAVEKAEVPPLVVVSASVPFEPLVCPSPEGDRVARVPL